MALKGQTSNPLDQLTRDEWRTAIAVEVEGCAFTDLSTEAQTVVDRIVNWGIEMISQRAAHEPWGEREYTATVSTGTDQTFDMPADFRHWVAGVEETSTGKKVVHTSTSKHFMQSHDGGTAHPWAALETPRYFFNGMTDDEPQQQQWRRVGVANSGATLRVRYRPYFALLQSSGEESIPCVPAGEARAILNDAKSQFAAFQKNTELAMFYKGEREDAIAALEITDRQTSEDEWVQGSDSEMARQMGD